MRDYDPTTGRYIQADPLGLVDGASVYGYVGQSPMAAIDPWGLQEAEARLYTSGSAFGTNLGNHAFLYGTECGCFAGTGGSSLWQKDNTDNGGNMYNRPYKVIQIPAGMSDRQFIDEVQKYLNIGPYVPGLWDCHSQMECAFGQMGLPYPGAPRGRSDLDERLESGFAKAIDWMYRNHGLTP